MDKRITKTRHMLQEALLTLLREKPLETIEIQEITERANTARVTFYRHYGTKEELLLDTLENIYQSMQSNFSTTTIENSLDFRQQPPEQILFEFLDNDRLLYKKLFTGSACAIIQQRLRHYIVRQIVLSFTSAPGYADFPIGLIANHMASTIIGNVMWWLSEDLPYSAAYMARITHWMAMSGAMTVIGQGDRITFPPPDAWRNITVS